MLSARAGASTPTYKGHNEKGAIQHKSTVWADGGKAADVLSGAGQGRPGLLTLGVQKICVKEGCVRTLNRKCISRGEARG